MPHPFRLNPKKGEILTWVWNRERTEKLVNGKQHSVWFVPTGMKELPQNVLLNFRLEFPKSELTIYLPSGISEIFCQMVSTPGHLSFLLVFPSNVHANTWSLVPIDNERYSLRGRRLKGKGKGFWARGKREGRARRKRGRETPARKPLFSPSRLLIMYAKITQLSNKSGRNAL